MHMHTKGALLLIPFCIGATTTQLQSMSSDKAINSQDVQHAINSNDIPTLKQYTAKTAINALPYINYHRNIMPGLIYALEIGKRDAAHFFIDNNADLYETDSYGETALHVSAGKKGYEDITQKLIDHKAHVNAKSENGFTPLHVAASRDNAEAIGVLLQNNAKKNPKDIWNGSPLYIAEYKKNANASKALIQAGATASVGRKTHRENSQYMFVPREQ